VQPHQPDCVSLGFRMKPGMTNARWGAGSRTGPFFDDACNMQRQGNGPWIPWQGPCEECTPPGDFIRRILGRAAEFYDRHAYQATAMQQTLRFDRSVLGKVIYICQEGPRGSTCGVYMRPQDWKGRTHVDIPDALWRADGGDCP
jgi:hypothetical protein